MVKIDLDEIQAIMKKGKSIEEIVSSFDWKEFENLVAEIFKANGFFVKKNLRFKTVNRYEIDILAVDSNVAFAADCKEWSRGRDKKSGLKNAVEKQEERAKHLKNFVRGNPIAQKSLRLHKQEIFPLIVTWFQEDLQRHNHSLIVPVWKLNSFLIQEDNFVSIE